METTVRPVSKIVFATRPGLGMASPPKKPDARKRFGDYCFRATCQVNDATGCPVGKMTGYDASPDIGARTEQFCGAHVRDMDLVCTAAEVVMLRAGDLQCSGQIVFVTGQHVKRLV